MLTVSGLLIAGLSINLCAKVDEGLLASMPAWLLHGSCGIAASTTPKDDLRADAGGMPVREFATA